VVASQNNNVPSGLCVIQLSRVYTGPAFQCDIAQHVCTGSSTRNMKTWNLHGTDIGQQGSGKRGVEVDVVVDNRDVRNGTSRLVRPLHGPLHCCCRLNMDTGTVCPATDVSNPMPGAVTALNYCAPMCLASPGDRGHDTKQVNSTFNLCSLAGRVPPCLRASTARYTH
jgi:hypothetical protein